MEEDNLDLSKILKTVNVVLREGTVRFGMGCALSVTNVQPHCVSLAMGECLTFYPSELEQLETIIRAIREAMEDQDV